MRTIQFLFCMGLGAAVGWLVGHIFSPNPGTAFDNTYQSRLDKALQDGVEVAKDTSSNLRAEFEALKRKT